MGLEAAPGVEAASSPLVRERLRFALAGAAPRLAEEEFSRSGELSRTCQQRVQGKRKIPHRIPHGFSVVLLAEGD